MRGHTTGDFVRGDGHELFNLGLYKYIISNTIFMLK